jgi:hypothetical protein
MDTQTQSIISQLKEYHPEIVEHLKPVFYTDNPEKRRRWKELFKDPVFH